KPVQKMATSTLKALATAGASSKGILDEASTLVNQVLTNFRAQIPPPKKKLIEFLANVGKDENPLVGHNRHVSALGALFALTLANNNVEDVMDVGFAGL